MATSVFFNNFTNSMEQTLIEDLVVESIRIFGIDIWYIPRIRTSTDDLLNEDDTPMFKEAYLVEVYVKNVDGFEGQGDFLSKFGLQIRDSVTLTIANRTFEKEITTQTKLKAPREGDLIYLPLNGKVFEIQHVEHEAIFYQMGSLQTMDLRCELYEFSNERFDTGIPEIDKLNFLNTSALNDISKIEPIDPYADNETIQDVANQIMDWSEKNPFGEDEY